MEDADEPLYKYQRRDETRAFYLGPNDKLYCLQQDGNHGFSNLRFYRCDDQGEPYLIVDMPFKEDFDKYIAPGASNGTEDDDA